MSSTRNYMDSKVALNFEDPSIYHDRVLVVGERNFYVVSGTLSVWSEHFRGLFTGNFNEAEKNQIELKELDADVLKIFLSVIYHNNSVDIKADDVVPLIELSYRFLTPMVLEYCIEYIDKNLDQLGKIKLQLLETACIYGNEGLKKKVIDLFKDENELSSSTIEKLLEICVEYGLLDLKKHTGGYMMKHLTFGNCSDYLDCCEKINSHGLKNHLAKAINSWKYNEIPPNLLIELSKSAFKHNVKTLKVKIRLSIFCLAENRGTIRNRKRDCLPGYAETTFNWFLQDNHKEIFALPLEISQFIIMSTCQSHSHSLE